MNSAAGDLDYTVQPDTNIQKSNNLVGHRVLAPERMNRWRFIGVLRTWIHNSTVPCTLEVGPVGNAVHLYNGKSKSYLIL